jgi:probable F420-dependent oxidoreductase
MDVGICVPHYGKPIEIERIVDIARRAEAMGFASVWVTDHILVPRTMNIIYRDNMLEPLALLSHLAAVVRRVRLGTSVIILPYRSPILVAKMLATIDQLSQGRVIFGTGAGWMEEEFRALNAPFADRGAFSDECLRIMRDIWTQDTVSMQGQFHRYEDMQPSPPPVQTGGPPIWVGGNSARSRRRAAELGDGWHSTGLLAAEMAPGCAHVRELWAKNGRQGEPVFSSRIALSIDGISQQVTSYVSRNARASVRGTVEAVVDQVGAFQALGLQHIVFEMSTQSHDSTLATMETFMARVKPQLDAPAA